MARISKYNLAGIAAAAETDSWRAALYLRLSREDGDKTESDSISNQKLLGEDFLLRHPEIDFFKVYTDDGYSGTNFERPAFLSMMEDIALKKVNCVIVKDLSRFGRNYVEAGKYLETVFPLFKVRFISINDNVDSTQNPLSMNNVMIPFKNIMNDEYCRDISVKIRSSLDMKRKKGEFIGSFAPYGYTKDPADRHRLIIDEEAAEVVRLIFDLFLKGKSILGISRQLNDMNIKNISGYKKSKGFNYRSGGKSDTTGYWSDYSVRRILTGRVYAGDMEQKKTEVVSYKVQVVRAVPDSKRITVENTHQPIISKETFEKVQELLKRDTRTSPQKNELGLFAGFIKCADCGRGMQKKSINQPYKNYFYYICSTYRKMSRDGCTKHTVRADKLEEVIFTAIKKYIGLAVDMDLLLEKIRNSSDKDAGKSRLRQALSKALQEKDKTQKILLDIYPDYKDGLIGKQEYFALKERYDLRLKDIESGLKKLEKEIEEGESEGQNKNAFVQNFIKHKGVTALTRELLTELVNNIYVHEGGGIEIDFKFNDDFLRAQEFININKNSVLEYPQKITDIVATA